MKRIGWLVCALFVLVLVLLFSSCGVRRAIGTEAEIVSADGFVIEGTSLSLTLPKGTESYSFEGKIEVSTGATWQISTDPNGMGYSLMKTVSIHEGDNIFYLFVFSEDGKTVIRYTALIVCEADWYVVKDGIITGVTEAFRAYAENICIPSEVNGEKITGIGGSAFHGCNKLSSIVVPEGITSIGNGAFADCSGLTSVTWNATDCSFVPRSRDDESDIFYDCTNLTTIKFGDTVKTIPAYVFSRCCWLTSVTISEGVTDIGKSAFYGCVRLASIIIPDSVKRIGPCAFERCGELTAVTIGSGVTSIEIKAFYCCSDSIVFTYHGTKAEWETVEKESGGDFDSYVVRCIDGEYN